MEEDTSAHGKEIGFKHDCDWGQDERPLILGDDLDGKVRVYIQEMR